jgi:mono/diheme cytochrome c family protein/glucose/arabinose dehydrogenase
MRFLLTLPWLTGLLFAAEPAPPKAPAPEERIAMIGNTLGERMITYGDFETELHLRYPAHNLTIRNLCHPGDTPALRPRAGRNSPWAFPGADKLRPEFKNHLGQGFEASPDEWLTLVKVDTILAFFGFNESFDGPEGVAKFEAELDAFATHTLAQQYNGTSAPRLVLVSPIAFEDRSDATLTLPDGTRENANLALYTAAIQRTAAKHELTFIDLFTPTRSAFEAKTGGHFTINGCHLNHAGYQLITPILADAAFGKTSITSQATRELLQSAIDDKNWHWFSDYRILNGVHVFGRRHRPFGPQNYPAEIEKLRQMTALRDQAIWKIASRQATEIAIDDSKTLELPEVQSNFKGTINYLDNDKALEKIEFVEGFQATVFASEHDFPNLRNPVQMTFDNRGRLWVAAIPSYPHYRPGDPKPNDKILIYEDTTGDGRADKETLFADGLHVVTGFEITPEGVYVSQQPNLVLLVDENGDDRADRKDILLHGFCSHDTHHTIGAFTSDASGAIYMVEGLFLHSQVETPYGAVRGTGAGVFRFDPRTFRLDRLVQTNFANPWGLAFDDWGQFFIADASGGQNWWALPISAKVPHGYNIKKTKQFAPKRARPTAGAEFIHSRHFPDEMQGDFMTNNCIGLLGTTTWEIQEDGAGFSGKVRGELLQSSDPNFRPVDMEFAPDGSLYLVDWHNALVGHMQHSARDPNRDHDHGRIYRITHKTRPLVPVAKVAGASITELLENLKLPEFRTRHRSLRELRARPHADVMTTLASWVSALDADHPRHDHHLLQALWVAWAQNYIPPTLLDRVLTAPSHQARAAAVNVVHHSFRSIDNAAALLLRAANDPHPRVRLEAIIAASWMNNADGARIALEALKHPLDHWMGIPFEAAMLTLRPHIETLLASNTIDLTDNTPAREFLTGKLKLDIPADEGPPPPPDWLSNHDAQSFTRGHEIYHRAGHCATCHGADGKGDGKFYPPLTPNPWVDGSPERLIKLTLKGIWGPMEVNGKTYTPEGGVPPMTPFEGLLDDEEVAAVLTYVRNSFGNKASSITEFQVKTIREATKEKSGFYTVDELLQTYPLEKPEP